MLEQTDEMKAATRKIRRDLRRSERMIDKDEARFLVDAFYLAQENRIRLDHQVRTAEETGEPTEVLRYLADQARQVEGTIKVSLDVYSANHPAGRWAREQDGVGPVIAAGLLAHIDIEKCDTVGQIWRFAGLDPTTKWEKGKKRPFNMELKTLCVGKLGDCFVKVSNKETAYYGRMYKARKEFEAEQNDAGAFAAQAKAAMARLKDKKSDAYKTNAAGKLTKGHIHRRSIRWAVKLFLSHFYEVWREAEGLPIEAPYPIKYLDGHDFYLKPNSGNVEGDIAHVRKAVSDESTNA